MFRVMSERRLVCFLLAGRLSNWVFFIRLFNYATQHELSVDIYVTLKYRRKNIETMLRYDYIKVKKNIVLE